MNGNLAGLQPVILFFLHFWAKPASQQLESSSGVGSMTESKPERWQLLDRMLQQVITTLYDERMGKPNDVGLLAFSFESHLKAGGM